ncbi:hypothetical protein E2562_035889 [Oryza meyeriana var. granulata]|uniref:O-methyltransferase dimerisation domain-containing protein n=1 Tax=Oryza meyeriana var. granulata TaxID=110450 RepID=A0A6G1ESW4_9ORYZ|nr:hypothetical protein E2562_035889 [Oryza meyeriana var. granulata]
MSMGLCCTIKLGIPTAIHRLGGAASVPSLMTKLSLPVCKQLFLRRLMRVLVTNGVFAADVHNDGGVERYCLTPLSCILVDGVITDELHSQTSFVLAATSWHYLEEALGLDEWFRKDVAPALPSPFEDVHGASLFDESTHCWTQSSMLS